MADTFKMASPATVEQYLEYLGTTATNLRGMAEARRQSIAPLVEQLETLKGVLRDIEAVKVGLENPAFVLTEESRNRLDALIAVITFKTSWVF